MIFSEKLTIELLESLMKEVQPSLEGREISSEQSVVDDLEMDSLDLLQLSRRLSRDFELDFDLDEWGENADTHGRTVGSILEHANVGVAA